MSRTPSSEDRPVGLHGSVLDLHHAYADVVMRRSWDDLDPLFAPGATVELDLVTSPVRRCGGVAGFRAFLEPAMERFAFLAFVILAAHVEAGATDEEAHSRLWFSEHRIDHDRVATQTYGLYRDDLVRTDRSAGDGGSGPAGWRYLHRRYRTVARLPEGDVFELPGSLSEW